MIGAVTPEFGGIMFSPVGGQTLASIVGRTPTLKATKLSPDLGADIYLKLEGANPTGSVKMRAAEGMVRSAIDRGHLPPGRAVVEPSSGNLGLALAMVCASHGIKCFLVVDPRMTDYSRSVMERYGAEVELVTEPDSNGSWQGSRVARARQIAADTGALLLFQYANSDNPASHAQTAREILDSLGEAPDSCVVGVSTGGQLTGIGTGLAELGAPTEMVGVDVEGSSIFGGRYSAYRLRGLGLSWWPENLDASVLDRAYRIPEKQAFAAARFVARRQQVASGGSAGAILLAAFREASNLRPGQRVLAVVPERADRYLEQFYSEQWLRSNSLEGDWTEHDFVQVAQSLRPLPKSW